MNNDLFLYIAEILKGFTFNFVFYLMLTGWGFLVARLFDKREASVHFGKLAVIGTAFLIFIGGVSVSSQTYTPLLGLLILSAGLISALAYLYLHRVQTISALKKISPVVWIALLFIAWRVGASVMGGGSINKGFNPADDFHGYLQLPMRIIQTGTMAEDMFNERRLLVLGGLSFLQAMYAQLAPLHWMTGVDSGVGVLLIAGMVLSLCPGWTKDRVKGVIIIFFVAVLQFKSVNIAGTYVGAALLLFILTETVFKEEFGARHAVLMGLVSAGCIATKNYMVVPVVATIFVWGFYHWRERSYNAIALSVVCVGATLLLLAPWLMLSYKSCGTMFYPITGVGNHGSRYGLIELVNNRPLSLNMACLHFKNFIILPDTLVCLFGLVLFRKTLGVREQNLYCWNIIVLLIFSWLFVWKSLFIMRYAAPFLGAGAVLTLIMLARTKKIVAATVCILVIVLFNYQYTVKIFLPSLQKHEKYEMLFPSEQMSLRKMQSFIPAAAPLAVFLSYPFLLDFARNHVHVFDHYGGACPPPGLPLYDEQGLKKYLLNHGLRYLAYSYGDEANYSRKYFGYRLQSDGNPLGDRIKRQAVLNFQFQDMLMNLRETEHVLFDDGKVFLLDLSASR